jgi:hypothetical protein
MYEIFRLWFFLSNLVGVWLRTFVASMCTIENNSIEHVKP